MNYPLSAEAARAAVSLTVPQRRLLPVERTGANFHRSAFMFANRVQALCDAGASWEDAARAAGQELQAASATPPAVPERPLARPTVYLGTHHPHWLTRPGIPLFVSDTRLRERKSLPRAACDWMLDSGGFSELKANGTWTVPPVEYVARVRRYIAEIGRLQGAAVQDWMVEPEILEKTGLTVRAHQWLTVQSYEELKGLAPEVPWIPVLQGWAWEEHREHLELYTARGHDLWALPVVGIGSVCRRQATREAALTIKRLADLGLKIHGFGLKRGGLEGCWESLTSTDSLAWSFRARRSPPMPGHTHKSCANCWEFAAEWYRDLHRKLDRFTSQRGLFDRIGRAA